MELNKVDFTDAVTANNITNCLTYVPQDINLTLLSGTLTLHKGSKIYTPNGAGVFDTTIIEEDKTFIPATSGTFYFFLFYDINGNFQWRNITASSSGTSDPGTAGTTYYNISTNIITSHNMNNIDVQVSFPLAMIKVESNVITSISMIFNGIGYIGSTMFIFPGLKGLISNGRNSNGSLKNLSYSVDRVVTNTFENSISGYKMAYARTNNELGLGTPAAFPYSESVNGFVNIGTNEINYWVELATCTTTNGVISDFAPKTFFHPRNYNNTLYAKNIIYTDTNRANDSNFTIDLSTACSNAGVNPSKVIAISYNGWVPGNTNKTQAYLRATQFNPPRASLFTWTLAGQTGTTQNYNYMFTIFYID